MPIWRHVSVAMAEALYACRPLCIFNHPLFPGQRFVLNCKE